MTENEKARIDKLKTTNATLKTKLREVKADARERIAAAKAKGTGATKSAPRKPSRRKSTRATGASASA